MLLLNKAGCSSCPRTAWIRSCTASRAGADEANPSAGLVQHTEGSLYGTTGAGSSSGCGAMFELAPIDEEKVFHRFTGVPDAPIPSAAPPLVAGCELSENLSILPSAPLAGCQGCSLGRLRGMPHCTAN